MILLALSGLAVGRAARLVVNDSWPFGRLEFWLAVQSGRFWGWLGRMVGCPWCVSGWLSLGACGALWVLQGLPVPPVSWFAVWWLSCASYWLVEVLALYGSPEPEAPPQHLDPWPHS